MDQDTTTPADTAAPTKAEMLIEMIADGEVLVSSNRHRADWPAEARHAAALTIRINDCFAFGCADSETVTEEGIEALHALWTRDPMWGGLVWAMIQRRQMPQEPVEAMLRESGDWDVDALRAEHGLLPNEYDGVMGVVSGMKHERYAVWRSANGGEPLPLDSQWWKGWETYSEMHPDWYDAQWRAREQAAIDAWYETSGHGARPKPAVDPAGDLKRAVALLETAGDTRRLLAEGLDDRHGGHAGTIAHAEKTAMRLLRGVERALAAVTQDDGDSNPSPR